MMNATLAFCILALTSSCVPPFLLIVLPRYVTESIFYLFQWLSVHCNGVVVLCVGFHNVDVES
ncbi:hypothetical protein NP493_63g03037 [Ridgeia piscesae]|uniref:Uncharacterized protein n=1 Tax=Ridgeia piscesae TaxID=27915 RepID=A0AAD9PA81_RIDPI|nr:hypothetical protein NP493_63g03037 [Ridgeia piscesae]